MAGEEIVHLACFNPRHGIHIVRNGKAVDMVICFHCGNMEVHTPAGEGEAGVRRDGQPYFDNVLRAANVPMPEY